MKLNGERHKKTLLAAHNYAATLLDLKRFEEVRELLRKTIHAARRVLGDSEDITLRMKWTYARAFCEDSTAPLDDLREAVTTLVELERTARQVFGGANPLTAELGISLQNARAALHARKRPPARDAIDAR